MSSGHKHAENMLESAQDAMETETPWERWECRRIDPCRIKPKTVKKWRWEAWVNGLAVRSVEHFEKSPFNEYPGEIKRIDSTMIEVES